MDKVKASPVQQQQQYQSRLLNRRKSLDPVRLREVRQELFGAEDFIAKVIEFDQSANETIIKIFELGLEVEKVQLKVVLPIFSNGIIFKILLLRLTQTNDKTYYSNTVIFLAIITSWRFLLLVRLGICGS